MTLICPKCGKLDAEIDLSLAEPGEMQCRECEETFTCDDVREYLTSANRWGQVLTWVESMPTEGECDAAAEEATAAG